MQPTAPHRDAPSGKAALLIVDMVNRFDFPQGERLKAKAVNVARTIQTLRCDVEAAGCPIVFVNDNFGQWHSEKSKLVDQASRAAKVVTQHIAPNEQDYFIIKPQFSGFYATNLQVLLPKLGVSRLILTGITTDICVLFTAADAHMRDYALWVPEDCVAALDDQRSMWALEMMRDSMGAETRPSTQLSLDSWIACPDAGEPVQRAQN